MFKIHVAFGIAAACGVLVACGNFARKNVCTNALDVTCTNDPINPSDSPSLNGPNPNFPDCDALATNPATDSCQPRLSVGDHASDVHINELMLDPFGQNFGAQKIELWNASTISQDLSGWALADGQNRFEFEAGTVLDGGRLLVVHLSAAGNSDSVDAYAPAFGELDHTHGELALIEPNGGIVDYVQWGAAGHAFEAVAALDGQWVMGSYCEAPIEGTSILFSGNGSLASDFGLAFESIGE